MNTTEEQRKQVAIKIMKQLNIYKPYINGYVKKNDVCFFDNFAGFWAYQDKDLCAKIKEVEQKYNVTVYAVAHSYTEFGEVYDMLVVTDYEYEWDNLLSRYPESCRKYEVFSYCWNKDHERDSEFGLIGVASLYGGIKRIA